jgi:4-amino-4-deoxy-L-arabinose transferase-like glycosyltransferase
MSQPSPALVAQDAVRPAPRWALLMLCAAYLLPGIVGRSPWRAADITAVGVMYAMAQGRTSWLVPTLGHVPVDAAPLPHSLGAVAIMALTPWLEPGLAARLPFVLLLATTLALTWYAGFYLARSEAAQPVAFAFGGEASHVDYARTIGDASVLALMATLGMLQLGHETTPELAQLASTTLLLWGMAAAPYRARRARLAMLAALPMLAASGAPVLATAMGLCATAILQRSQDARSREAAGWVLVATVVAAVIGSLLAQWHWRYIDRFHLAGLPSTARMLVWFLWPSWLLALWTIWRWRRQSLRRHIAAPLSIALVAVVASIVMGGAQRALLPGLPAFALLAAFALPTLKRSTGAAIDWFSMFLFTGAAVVWWVVYASLLTGIPAKPAANVAKLYEGYVSTFSPTALLVALMATLAWFWLVRWRTGRHRRALWKSMVLPAGGVALSWLLVMTLLLPLADYVRSMRPWVDRLRPHLAAGCVAAPGMPAAYVAALEIHAQVTIDAREGSMRSSTCRTALLVVDSAAAVKGVAGWRVIERVRRPSDRQESTLVLRRL